MFDNDTDLGLPVQYDLLITEARNFRLYFGITELHSGILDVPCKTFQKNVERVSLLASVPQMVTDAVTKHILMLCESTFKVLKKPVIDDTELGHLPAISAQYDLVSYAHNRSDGFFGDKHKMLNVFVSDALNYHKYESIASPLRWPGYHALLGSQVISAWAAFETLVEDVWIAAVNAHPKLAMKAYRGKNFTLDELNKHGFNVSENLGDLLKDRMNFGHLVKEREVYLDTFPMLTKLNKALARGALEAAHCVRNSLVHDGGHANDGYEKVRSTFPLPWRNVTQGRQLPLDGKNVARLTSIIVLTGNRLLRDVDCWLLQLGWPEPKSPPQAP